MLSIPSSSSNSHSNNNNNNNNNINNETIMSQNELKIKLKEYIHFIDTILQPELSRVTLKRDNVERDIEEYKNLKVHVVNFIRKRKNKEKERLQNSDDDDDDGEQEQQQPPMALVDLLQCQTIFCQARIKNQNQIFVDIGKGIYTELTLEEAISFIDKRIYLLETNVLPKCVEKAKTVAAHLEESLGLLESLGKEIQSME